MKVALVTIYNVINYGAELQAYATYRALNELGCEVELVDVRLHYAEPSLRNRILFANLYKEFEQFRNFAFPNRSCYYKTIEDIRENPPVADLYLVGSDQVWNIDITKKLAPLFFLDFGTGDVRRASYASSFGVVEWSGGSQITEIAQKRFKEFVEIGVREASGVSIVRDNFGVEAKQVLDPTMLFDSYPAIISDPKRRNEIVCYKFVRDKSFFDLARYISKRLDRPVKLLNGGLKPYLGFKYCLPMGPKKWVKSIAESSFVITDSFHGLAFSIIYRKQFIVLVANPKRMGRLQNLLTLLGLEDRLYLSYDQIYKNDQWLEQIDYNMIDQKLKRFQEESWAFLKRVVNKSTV